MTIAKTINLAIAIFIAFLRIKFQAEEIGLEKKISHRKNLVTIV